MTDGAFHLAEFNISRLLAPLDDPLMKEFVDFLDPVNTFAEQSPGFVWRMTGTDGEAASFMKSPFADPMMITNLTLWADIESLRAFAYQTVHRYFLQSRRKWFDRVTDRQLVMWWQHAGQIPTLELAMQKLRILEESGPSPDAFTFQDAYDQAGLPLPRQMRAEAIQTDPVVSG